MYQEAFEKIKNAKAVAVVPHRRPDGDTVGSSLGLHHALEYAGIKSVVVCSDAINRKLHFIPGVNKIKKEIPKNCDLVVSVDTAAKDRMGAEAEDLEIVVVDHHASNRGFGTVNVIEPEFASTGEVVYKFLKENDLKINRPCAKALYAAIVSDSRSFIIPRVTEETFKAASELVAKGADIVQTTKNLRYSMALSEMRIFGEALKSFELIKNGKISLCVITLEMLKNCGAEYNDTEDIADFLLGAVTAEASILLIERKEGGTKCSLRSKGSFGVLDIAKKFDGGGHINAAGFDVSEEPFSVREKIIEILKEEEI